MIGCRSLLRVWRTAGALGFALLLPAHIGTDDVFYSGTAGPWPVQVSIRQPGVIPGLADINVRVGQPGVGRVLVTARRTLEGGGEAPPPDQAKPVRGETGLYSAQLWLMVRGPHEVVVTVEGEAGTGVARVPVEARATRQLEMARGLVFFVIGGGLFLVIGLLTIVLAASGESVVEAGDRPGPIERRRAWRAAGLAAVLVALVVFGGWTWIRSEAAAHRARLDRPWTSEATMRLDGGPRGLDFAITEPIWANRNDEAWRTRNNRYRRADLVPDHGKMMHMFIVREPDLDAFAHIHPVRVDDSHFSVAFPPLPTGTYRVYADISQQDGSSRTLYTHVDAPATAGSADAAAGANGVPAADPDDAWWTDPTTARALEASPVGTTAPPGDVESALGDALLMRWLGAGEPLVAGEDAELSFRVQNADGSSVALDPYMGMSGHAMLNRLDGEVFVHLHPTGMVSMAAKSAIDGSSGMSGMPMGADMAGTAGVMAGRDGTVRFPLVVPQAGRYRIWVQVRYGERVLTGSFDTEIRPAG